jgi:hypothetical protein
MNKGFLSLLSLVMIGAAMPAMAQDAPAKAVKPQPAGMQVTPGTTIETELRTQVFGEENSRFGTTGSNHTQSAGEEARFKLTSYFNPDTLFFWEGRGVATLGRGGFETSDTGSFSNSENFLEWRQSYLEFDNLGGTPVYARVGRQRVREDYGVMWNQNFDALRLGYDTTTFKGNLTAGQNLFSYSTVDNDFNNNDKQIANLMAEGSWQYFYEQFVEARALLQNDHSGLPGVGTTELATDTDDRDGRIVWGNLRAMGDAHSFLNDAGKIHYRADIMAMTGNEDVATTAAGAPGFVTVTGSTHQDVRAWAFDAATDIPLPASTTQLHLGYAYGSGDNNAADGTDHAFRQTGLDGNSGRFGALSKNADYYGTVLRPDLSNLHIFSAGATRPVMQASDIGVIYRYYRLDEPATALPASGVLNTLNGVDRDLGHGLDVLFNVDILREWNMNMTRVHDMDLRTSVGAFRTGSAYGANDGEYVLRGLAELKVSF